MNASRCYPPMSCPRTSDLAWFARAGVEAISLATPEPLLITHGKIEHDGLFEPTSGGERWFAFEMHPVDDVVVWQPAANLLASWTGRCFALGENVIGNAATCSFDRNLNIYGSPLEWLEAKRDGIVVLPRKWPEAFDRLRDVPRVAIVESLLPLYRRYMRPHRMPQLFVMSPARRAA